MTPLVTFLLAVGVLFLAMKLFYTEKFEPGKEYDRAQVTKTMEVEDSSYSQRTNHADAAPYVAGPIEGSESPFQVNQFKAYIA